MQVKCPECKWTPAPDTEWACEGCGYHWNVFETAGRCPQCHFQHETTYCPEWEGGCGETTPHLDWYEGIDEGLAEINIKRLFE